MKAMWMTGALTAAIWGGAALAGETTTTTIEQKSTSSQNDFSNPSAVSDPAYSTPVVIQPSDQQVDVTVTDNKAKSKTVISNSDDQNRMRGIVFLLGGGVEGYSGALAPRLQLGPSWGVSAAIKPTKVLGFELGYSGATNEIDNGAIGFDAGEARGADIIRNGGRALATLALGTSALQPYVMGGVGIDRYTVRVEGAGFHDDTSGSIPVGVGLRGHWRGFTADARVGYSWLFNSTLSDDTVTRRNLGLDTLNTGRYQGMIQVGSTF